MNKIQNYMRRRAFEYMKQSMWNIYEMTYANILFKFKHFNITSSA